MGLCSCTPCVVSAIGLSYTVINLYKSKSKCKSRERNTTCATGDMQVAIGMSQFCRREK